MFALLFIIPFAFQFAFNKVAHMPFDISYWGSRIVNMSGLALYTAWIYAACKKLCDHSPDGTHPTIDRIKVTLLFPVLHILWQLFCTVVYHTGTGSWLFVGNNNWALIFSQGISVLMIVGLFYGMYAMARLLNAVEHERPVRFAEFIGDFFLILFFPIGIWNIQGRLNDIAARMPDDMDIFKQEPV